MLLTKYLSLQTRRFAKQWHPTLLWPPGRASFSRMNQPSMQSSGGSMASETALTSDVIYGWANDSIALRVGCKLPNKSPDIEIVHQASPVGNHFRVVIYKEDTFQHHLQLQRKLAPCPYLYTFIDYDPSLRCLMFQEPRELPPEQLDMLLLHVSGMDWFLMPWPWAKGVLKDVLQGIVHLHEQNAIHTDIRAENVYLNTTPNFYDPRYYYDSERPRHIHSVQLAGLERVRRITHGSDDDGGAYNVSYFQSPEALVGGLVSKPSDMFSFGALCIYTSDYKLPFHSDGGILDSSYSDREIILAKQMSFLANEEQIYAFLHHIGRNEWAQKLVDPLAAGAIRDHPNHHLDTWTNMDENFRDLVKRLMAFDPSKRITAAEALNHAWFQEGWATMIETKSQWDSQSGACGADHCS